MTETASEETEVLMCHRTAKGTLVRSKATLLYANGRILFLKSPFALKDEIKAMKGSRWHGYDEDPVHVLNAGTDDEREIFKVWSVLDCQRNRFQLAFLTGDDVYEWFDRDLVEHDFGPAYKNGVLKELMKQQLDMANAGLTYHYQIFGAEMGTGKTLAAMLVIKHSGIKHIWWVGPRTSLPNMRKEFREWGFPTDIKIEWMTYEEVVRRMDEYKPGDFIPQMVVCDESSRCKGATSQRTNAVQMLGDLVREKYGFDGYLIEMSGTPSPNNPTDWWSQTEIAWPGFLKEGSPKQLQARLAFMVDKEYDTGIFKKPNGWKDNEAKCKVCGMLADQPPHCLDGEVDPADYHPWEESVNEVALMYDRLNGLVRRWLKKDCLQLPEKRYRRVVCKPTPSILRVSSALMQAAPNAMTGLTWLRELSDGFQYKDVKEGTSPCPHCVGSCGVVEEWFDTKTPDRVYQAIDMLDKAVLKRLEKREVACPRCNGTKVVDKIVRITREVPCPKEDALKLDLERCEEVGRIVIFAGFTGSVDRIANICRKEGWAVVRCDGRGFEVTVMEGKEVKVITGNGDEALAYWSDMAANPRVAFVAHPESGGMSLTLVEARMAIFWSNSFKAEFRAQAEDRIHRKGMDENLGCEIVDYVHLPTDMRVIEVIKANRKLELMTLGEFRDGEDILLMPEPDVVIEELAA